jgi:CheY-like chemotaxis protein
MAQVIDNITINARQAMPKGGTIFITAENIAQNAPLPHTLKPGPYVKIVMRDQGCGIAPDNLPNVFDPFFTTKEHGSGLGVATAESITKKHSGAITIDSTIDVGTTVSIYLPALPNVHLHGEDTHGQSGEGHGSVLVVDDEEIIRRSCEKMLTHMGFTAFAANGDREAAAVVGAQSHAGRPIGVAIIDLTLKNSMSGVDVIKQLKAIDPVIVAIVSSGYSDDPVLADPVRSGFQGALYKPYTYEDLKKAVCDAMEIYNSGHHIA